MAERLKERQIERKTFEQAATAIRAKLYWASINHSLFPTMTWPIGEWKIRKCGEWVPDVEALIISIIVEDWQGIGLGESKSACVSSV